LKLALNSLSHSSPFEVEIDGLLERLNRLVRIRRFNVAANALLAGLYVATAWLGLSLAPLHRSVSPIWPPTGIAMAALLLFGYRLWPGIFAGAFLVNLVVPAFSPGILPYALAKAGGIGLGNTLEALAGAWLANRFAGGRNAFARTSTILRFAFFCGVLSTAISATFGALSLALTHFADWRQFGPLCLTWWMGDAVSAIIITPLVLIWSRKPDRFLTRRESLEFGLLMATLLIAGELVFGYLGLSGPRYPLAYLMIPFLIWAALRFGSRAVISVVFILSCIAVEGTLRGAGPFAVSDLNTSLLLLHGFMCTITISTLSLSAEAAEAVRVQSALRREKTQLTDLAENAPVGLHWILPDGTIQWANKVEFEIFGYAADEYVGHSMAEFCADPKAMDIILSESRRGGRLSDYETQMRCKDGTLRTVLISANGYWEGDTFVQTRCFVRDITERKKDELRVEAFSKLGHRLNAVTTQKAAAQVIVEMADKLFGWDACSLDLFSAQAGTLQPVLYMDLLEGGRQEVSSEQSAVTVPTQRSRLTIEKGAQLILRKDGAAMPPDAKPFGDKSRPSASIMSVPIREEANVIGVLCIHSYTPNAYSPADLQLFQALADYCSGAFNRIRAQEEIVRLNRDLEKRVRDRTEQLEAANRELEAFCYSVSHDLRAPLRTIRGFTEALMELSADQLDFRSRDFLRRTSEAAQQMDRLVDDLLKLSRVGRSEVRHQTVNLSALAGLIVEELRRGDPMRSVEVIIAPNLIAYGDERLLRIVLENLLRNAWKFTGKRAEPRIELGRDNTGAFFVRDNGAGFDMAYAEKLFGVFQRLHSAAEFPGTGVGLAIVHRIITRHGGRTSAVGKMDEGATFYFILPAEDVSRK
jgi:PAS domain S-box-containing protein